MDDDYWLLDDWTGGFMDDGDSWRTKRRIMDDLRTISGWFMVIYGDLWMMNGDLWLIHGASWWWIAAEPLGDPVKSKIAGGNPPNHRCFTYWNWGCSPSYVLNYQRILKKIHSRTMALANHLFLWRNVKRKCGIIKRYKEMCNDIFRLYIIIELLLAWNSPCWINIQRKVTLL